MFIPIKDDAPTIRRPYLTVSLIAANTLIFLFSFFQGLEGFSAITYRYGYVPVELVRGVEITPSLPASPYLTAFTSMFMHGGWLHLIGNMLFLWIYGNNIEDYFGPIKFILFYVLSGLAAVLLYTLFGPNSQVPMVGASGAIAGVMGAYMVLHPRARITVLIIFFFIQFVVLPAKVVLGIWFAIQLFMSFAGSSTGGGTAWMAHVGGFVFGYAVMRLLVRRRGGAPPTRAQRIYKMDW